MDKKTSTQKRSIDSKELNQKKLLLLIKNVQQANKNNDPNKVMSDILDAQHGCV